MPAKRTRKSTAILLAVWVATLVLYIFVKPAEHESKSTPPIVNTMLSNYLPNTSEPAQR
ncbi:hypothetical protein [Nocardia seriolae]|uniref:hypothetical protein n=1 Tax=Nocardia seriolae TaxID=37332 RepID=UPI0013140438|nr:hypothetical protein [Nocardia seriolae]QUN15251.1 hypothetical protein KEC46_22990 [Nocardia seriolae]WKY51060.1 hypothetical protein Q5P07_29505 [Nocardia seriolae]WNJ57742.1 hypothetical protein RMO66_30800 [Nocardia seriolae]BEK93809.1 hypothetical protein NSER024013_17150 [Nocardia seriolae]